MDKIMARCEKLAGDPALSSSPGNLTATGEAIRSAKSSSKLASWVQRWEDALSSLFYYTAIDLGIIKPGANEGWGGVSLNRVFVPLDRNIEGARLAAERNQAGKLSDETTFDILKAAEIVPEDIDFEEEKVRIAQEGPSLSSAGRGSALARRVLELVQGGMDQEEAMSQAEAEQEGGMPMPKKPMPPEMQPEDKPIQ
jgi:hypothetical protein